MLKNVCKCNFSILNLKTFGNICFICLFSQPHVDFGIKLGGADLMSIPGLYGFVQVLYFLGSFDLRGYHRYKSDAIQALGDVIIWAI